MSFVRLRSSLYRLLEQPEISKSSQLVNIVIYILIMINILNLMIASVEELYLAYGSFIDTVEHMTMTVFIIEYLLRVIASGEENRYRGFKGKLSYLFSRYALIDLLSILPYLLSSFGYNSSFVRGLRLLRIFRIFRLQKYAYFAAILKDIFISKKEEFMLLIFYTLLLITIISFIIYDVEHTAQPEVFSSILTTLWWAVATLTTVGYGDMYPVTGIGQFLTSIVILVGIAFIAIPGGLFASEFLERFSKKSDDDRLCKNCGSSDIQDIHASSIKLPETLVFIEESMQCNTCGFIGVTVLKGE